jgi:hypothetical protein
MSGIVHTILTRRTFTFTNLGNTLTQDVPLMRAVDVTDAKDITLAVRVHSRTFSGGGSIQVIARAISLTSEEPDVDFLSAGSDLATITLNTAAPTLHLASLSTPFGQMVRVLVVGTGATAATITATISIDLIVRDT